MDDKLKLNVLTIIKKAQLKIIDTLEDDYSKTSKYLDYEDGLSQVDSDTRELVEQIEEKSHYFTIVVDSEDEMLNLFKDFFEEINPYINKITTKYKNYKKDEASDFEIFQHHMTVLVVQDILNDYINFLVKLEGAILGLYDKQVVLNIKVNEQIEIIEFVQKNTDQSIFMPLLLSFGAGYLFGDV